jgi:hypothetical protein
VRPIGHRFVGFALIVSVQVMTLACSSRSGAVPAQPGPAPSQQGTPTTTADAKPDLGPDECALIALPGEPIATVGLTDRIEASHAPRPTNPSERLLFSQLYETLVRVDCMGRVRPGLASSWRLDEKSAFVWTVTLREDARFSDGSPVTAADVRAGWTRNGVDRQFQASVSRLVEAVTVVDDRTLVIQLADRRTLDAPMTLAHPHLAIARRVANSPWPMGSRSSRLETSTSATEVTVNRDHLPALRFLLARSDPRDLLDAGADLLLTRDPATLGYAATLPHYQRVPLAWQRTHIFLASGPSAVLSDDERRALAVDAVRGEARGAQDPLWFETVNCHQGAVAGLRAQVPTPRIVYDENDPAARDLAERFVALARRTFQRATGLSGEALAKTRRDGTDAGYIASVDSRPLDPCLELAALLDSFPWLRRTTIVPLVDTRLQAVVRRGRSGLITEFDGSVLIDGVNDPRSR